MSYQDRIDIDRLYDLIYDTQSNQLRVVTKEEFRRIFGNLPLNENSEVDLDSLFYDKSEVDDKIKDFCTIADVESELDDYYTKSDIDSELANYTTESDVDAKLTNYYTKSDADTKLTNYYTKSDVDTELANYTTESDVDAKLVNYTTESDVDNKLANYTTESDVDTKLTNYYTKSDVDTELTDYYTKSDVDTELTDYYTKTDVDSKLSWITPSDSGITQGTFIIIPDLRIACWNGYNNMPVNTTTSLKHLADVTTPYAPLRKKIQIIDDDPDVMTTLILNKNGTVDVRSKTAKSYMPSALEWSIIWKY